MIEMDFNLKNIDPIRWEKLRKIVKKIEKESGEGKLGMGKVIKRILYSYIDEENSNRPCEAKTYPGTRVYQSCTQNKNRSNKKKKKQSV